MVLAIDVGNSTTTIGLFDESGVLHLRSDLTTSQRSTRDQCAVSLRGVFDLYEIVPGFLGNLVVAWAVSRTSLPSEEISEEFDAAVTASRA